MESSGGDDAAGIAVGQPSGSRRAAAHPSHLPLPRVTQPWLVPFRAWRERYAYFVDCILGNILASMRYSMQAAAADRPAMRLALERYLYRTGHNRFKSFAQLSGPRPPRCCYCMAGCDGVSCKSTRRKYA